MLRQRLLIRRQRLRQPVEFPQHFRPAILGHRILRMLRQRLLIRRQRLRQPVQFTQHFRTAILGHRILRMLRLCILIRRQGLRQPVQLAEGFCTSTFVDDMKRIKADGLIVACDCFLVLVQARQGVAELAPCPRIIRLHLNGQPEQRLGETEHPPHFGIRGQIAKRFGGIRSAAELPLELDQAARVVEGLALMTSFEMFPHSILQFGNFIK